MIRSASPVWAFVELDDRLSFAGRRWRFDDVPVRPRPVPRPGAAQQRPPWRDELERLGRDPAAYRVGIIRPWLVTDEGDRLWPRIRDAKCYRDAQYAQWSGLSPR